MKPIALILSLACMAANATNQKPPSPPKIPATSSNASANAGAAAGASARASQRANSGSSISGDSSSSLYILPGPVFTPPLPMIDGCPGANIQQSAWAAGWNFVSVANSSVNTDNCTAIMLYNSFVATCKYASAHQILNLLSAKVLPGFQFSELSQHLIDLPMGDCTKLAAPIQKEARIVTIKTPKRKPSCAPKLRQCGA